MWWHKQVRVRNRPCSHCSHRKPKLQNHTIYAEDIGLTQTGSLSVSLVSMSPYRPWLVNSGGHFLVVSWPLWILESFPFPFYRIPPTPTNDLLWVFASGHISCWLKSLMMMTMLDTCLFKWLNRFNITQLLGVFARFTLMNFWKFHLHQVSTWIPKCPTISIIFTSTLLSSANICCCYPGVPSVYPQNAQYFFFLWTYTFPCP